MIRALLVVAAFLGLWELYCALSGVDQLVLPSPLDVADSLVQDRSLLWSALLTTAGELILGLVLALLVATAAAVGIHLSRTLRQSLYPLLVASQTIPVPVIASLLVVWLGYDLAPKVVIVALVAFFPVVVGILDGLAGVDPELNLITRSFGAGRLRSFALAEAPAAIPGALTGLRIAVVISVIGAVFAEQAGGDSGLGFVIQQALPQLLTSRAYAAVVVLSTLALASFGLLTFAQRRLLPWTRLGQSER